MSKASPTVSNTSSTSSTPELLREGSSGEGSSEKRAEVVVVGPRQLNDPPTKRNGESDDESDGDEKNAAKNDPVRNAFSNLQRIRIENRDYGAMGKEIREKFGLSK